jgi:protease IV
MMTDSENQSPPSSRANENNQDGDFFQELAEELRLAWQLVRYGLGSSGVWLRNQLRVMRQRELDYVVLQVGGPLPERSAPPRSFIQRQLPLPPEPLSLQTLNRRLRVIADAANVRGIVFVFTGFSTSMATLQNFRRAISRLQAAGKKVVVYTPYLNLPHFFAATSADRIVVPPSATFEVLGLRTEAFYLKDALAHLGVEAEVLQISPYKTAYNFLDKADMSPEERQQLDWLLDDMYDTITAGIATGRNMEQAAVLELIDQAPFPATEALARGLIDDVAYEDRLPFLLASDTVVESDSELASEAGLLNVADGKGTNAPLHNDAAVAVEAAEPTSSPERTKQRSKAHLANWPEAREILLEKVRRPLPKHIGVVSLEGAIALGPSRQPPIEPPLPLPMIGGTVAGEETLTDLLRQVEKDRRLAALVLYVDSPGGDALASDLIGRQVERIAQKLPVLAYMGGVAASGGYYVSAPASHIMSQTMTMTGSIGVIMAHISTAGLFKKLNINRVHLNRGKRAALYGDNQPLTEDERQALWQGVVDTYRQFKEVVAKGRDLPLDELDPICEGRVWSGRQALDYRLVDSHGDFIDALDQAAKLAKLKPAQDEEIPVINFYPQSRSYTLPQPYDTAEELIRLISLSHVRDLADRPLRLMPFHLRFW